VYLNIQQSGLYKVACRYPTFTCAYVISWIVSHIDEKTMTLSSDIGHKLYTFRAEEYQCMYHFPEAVERMDSLFHATHIYVNTRYIVKGWVKETSKFWQIPTHVYKKKSLRKAYQLLVILSCKIHGQ